MCSSGGRFFSLSRFAILGSFLVSESLMAGLHHAIVADNCKTGKSNGLTRNNPRPYGGLLAKVLILRSSARQHIHVQSSITIKFDSLVVPPPPLHPHPPPPHPRPQRALAMCSEQTGQTNKLSQCAGACSTQDVYTVTSSPREMT